MSSACFICGAEALTAHSAIYHEGGVMGVAPGAPLCPRCGERASDYFNKFLYPAIAQTHREQMQAVSLLRTGYFSDTQRFQELRALAGRLLVAKHIPFDVGEDHWENFYEQAFQRADRFYAAVEKHAPKPPELGSCACGACCPVHLPAPSTSDT